MFAYAVKSIRTLGSLSLTVLYVLGCPSAMGQAATVSGESEAQVRKAFGAGIEGTGLLIRTHAVTVSAEVCADGCDVFQWKGSIHDLDVWDFILLYEYKVGFGSDFESFRQGAEASIQSALKRASKYCQVASPQTSEFQCGWAPFAKAKVINVGVANYDEGQRCFAWKDPSLTRMAKKYQCSPIRESPWSKKGR